MNWEKFFSSARLMDSAKRRLAERVEKVGDCQIWRGARGSRGYGSMSIGKYWSEASHRVAWAIDNGKRPPKGMHVMHSCDTPSCVNPLHLSIGTAKDNQRDCSIKGRKKTRRGSRHEWSRYTEEQMISAASLFAAGKTYAQVSERLCINRGTLEATLQGRRWPHIQPIIRAILGRDNFKEAA